jgi:hypothetical protein
MIKQKSKKHLAIAALTLFVLLPVGFVALLFLSGLVVSYDRAQTLHSPIFSPDGMEIYFVERNSRGVSWGPGIEHFTPPASVIITRDEFALKAVDKRTGSERTLHVFNVPPSSGPRKEYRNRLFGIPSVELRWEESVLKYKIGLDILPDEPNTRRKEWSIGHWGPKSGEVFEANVWANIHETAYPWHEGVLSGSLEVINYKDVAILLKDSADNSTRVFLLSDNSQLSETDIHDRDIDSYSHRNRLERIRNLRETKARLIANYIAHGLTEGAAFLKTSKDLERMGLIPKGPKIIAQKAKSPSKGLPVFTISKDEFRFGLFQDIEKAVLSPGAEIDFWGNYIRHRDFNTSREINEWLNTGNTSFYIRTSDALYIMNITPQETRSSL